MKLKQMHFLVLTFWGVCMTTFAVEYHVAKGGDDSHKGSINKPFSTIQKAADVAMPGDVITVHEGIYREEINPPRGGTSDEQRIIYQAAEGEHVEIRGSEVVTGWARVEGDVWSVEIDHQLFGDFNPFADIVDGPWFNARGASGTTLRDGEWLDVNNTDAVSYTHLTLPTIKL